MLCFRLEKWLVPTRCFRAPGFAKTNKNKARRPSGTVTALEEREIKKKSLMQSADVVEGALHETGREQSPHASQRPPWGGEREIKKMKSQKHYGLGRRNPRGLYEGATRYLA